ncbi:unnamed protein product, partial [Ixodes pacificus]
MSRTRPFWLLTSSFRACIQRFMAARASGSGMMGSAFASWRSTSRNQSSRSSMSPTTSTLRCLESSMRSARRWICSQTASKRRFTRDTIDSTTTAPSPGDI